MTDQTDALAERPGPAGSSEAPGSPPPPDAAAAPERVQVLVRLPASMHRDLKVAAAKSGQSIQSVVEQAVQAALAAHDAGASPPPDTDVATF